jgi:hypothetical protein
VAVSPASECVWLSIDFARKNLIVLGELSEQIAFPTVCGEGADQFALGSLSAQLFQLRLHVFH